MDKNQPPLSAPEFHQPQTVAPYPQDDAGKTMGIIGLVLAFTGLQLVGLVLSIMGYVKSKRAGLQNTPALIGIILNGLIIFVVALIIAFFVFLVANNIDNLSKGVALQQSHAQGQTDSETTAAGEKAAYEIALRTKLYHTANGIYPLIRTDFERDPQTSLEQLEDVIISPKPLTSETAYQTDTRGHRDTIISYLELYACGATEGNKIGYWDTTKNEVAYIYSGLAGPSSTCAIMK